MVHQAVQDLLTAATGSRPGTHGRVSFVVTAQHAHALQRAQWELYDNRAREPRQEAQLQLLREVESFLPASAGRLPASQPIGVSPRMAVLEQTRQRLGF